MKFEFNYNRVIYNICYSKLKFGKHLNLFAILNQLNAFGANLRREPGCWALGEIPLAGPNSITVPLHSPPRSIRQPKTPPPIYTRLPSRGYPNPSTRHPSSTSPPAATAAAPSSSSPPSQPHHPPPPPPLAPHLVARSDDGVR
jgi:hypothetical protein